MCSASDVEKCGDYSICDRDDYGISRYTYFSSSDERDHFYDELNIAEQLKGLVYQSRIQLETFTSLRKDGGIIGVSSIKDFDVPHLCSASRKVIEATGPKAKISLVKSGIFQRVKQNLILNPKALLVSGKAIEKSIRASPGVGQRICSILQEVSLGVVEGLSLDRERDSSLEAIQF